VICYYYCTLQQATNFGVQYHHASETFLSTAILSLEPAYVVTVLGGEQLHLNEHIYIYAWTYWALTLLGTKHRLLLATLNVS
jgi:hypothetical protein